MLNTVLDLNNPDTRQASLADRLNLGESLVITTIAKEFGVSTDTIRRDFISLEMQGLMKRVKGGAIPLQAPVKPITERLTKSEYWLSPQREAIAELINNCQTILLDGGTSVLEFAEYFPIGFSGLVVTPSPLVAVAMLEADIETLLIGGHLKSSGGIATGAETVRSLANIHADLCVLGACGFDLTFGLSADDMSEAQVKQQMIQSSNQSLVLASTEKLNTRARHRVATSSAIHLLMTNATDDTVAPYADAGLTVMNTTQTDKN